MAVRIRAFLAFALLALNLQAANVYIRKGASGAGTTWSDALGDTLSATAWVRGNTYYFAKGSGYAAATFSTATSGTTAITIKRATQADHGTDTGWDPSYDGQVTFAYDWTVTTSYWTIDGQTEGGFYILQPAITAATQHYIRLGNGTHTITNSSFANISFDASTDDQEKIGVNCHSQSTTADLMFSHIRGSHLQNLFKLLGTTTVTIEHCYADNNFSSSGHHGEVINCRKSNGAGVTGLTLRYCQFPDTGTGATGVVVANNAAPDELSLDGALIYCNIIGNSTAGNGVITSTTNAGMANVSVYNNVIYTSTGPWFSPCQPTASATIKAFSIGNTAKNNIVYNMSGALGDNADEPIDHDYNGYFVTTSTPTETNGVTGGSSPFVNAGSGDFRLPIGSAAIGVGTDLSAVFTDDIVGVAFSNPPSMGAYEGPPAAPTIGTASPLSSASMSVTFTDNSGGTSTFLVRFGTDNMTWPGSTTADSSPASVTGLSPSTTYYFQVAATNGDGTSAYSSSASGTTDAAPTDANPAFSALLTPNN